MKKRRKQKKHIVKKTPHPTPKKVIKKENTTTLHTKSVPVVTKSHLQLTASQIVPTPPSTQQSSDSSHESQTSSLSEGESAPQDEGLTLEDIKGIYKKYRRSVTSFIRKSKVYPLGARRRGLEGKVVIKIEINSRGKILDVALLRSSGHTSLDESTLKWVKQLDHVPAPPQSLKWKKRFVKILINYQLNT